jgi:hypothetical protein
MPSPQRFNSDRASLPPAYQSEQAYGRGLDYDDEDEEEVIYRPHSRAPFSLMPGGVGSSRATANSGAQRQEQIRRDDNGAGIGAGSNAYLTPETPSMYTDPYEYDTPTIAGGSSVLGDANILSNRPDATFLGFDPYSEGQTKRTLLARSNTVGTLGPNDSVSAYNVNAISRNLEQETASKHTHQRGLSQQSAYDTRPYSYAGHHQAHEADETYYNAAPYGVQGSYDASGDDVPLKNYSAGMGYAEDDDYEMKEREMYWNDYLQRENYDGKQQPPSLFANHNLQPDTTMMKGDSLDDEEGREDGKGLLQAMPYGHKQGAKPGWGGTLEEQIRRRKRGVGRQRWPILTWLLSIAYVAVFIVELIKSKQETGQAIQTKPSWNPMLGPPFEFLISFGARFVPCTSLRRLNWPVYGTLPCPPLRPTNNVPSGNCAGFPTQAQQIKPIDSLHPSFCMRALFILDSTYWYN